MLTRAGLTSTQLDQVTGSPAFGALSTALRRAEAHGLNLEAALPRLIEHADAGTVDLASVVHTRLERWTDMSGSSASQGRGFVLGLFPAATAEDPEMAAALTERVRLIEQRADELIDRALTADAPWLAQLGPEPADPQNAATWRTRARTVVAYRERHQITDPWSALGTADGGNAQQRREGAIAARALSGLKPSPAIAPTRSAPASLANPTHANTIGR